jgi:probable lipoprotein (TIGR04455 family)
MDGYEPADARGIKHVALRVWSPTDHPGLAPVMTRVAFDFVNQYTNYLVHSNGVMKRDWAEACGELQGVLALRATRVIEAPGGIAMEVTAELYRCSDGALVWRADGAGTYAQKDVDLQNMVAAYEQDLGSAATRYAVPVFGLLQDLMRELPNPPELTEEEILQKIELEVGSCRLESDRARAAL